MFDSSVLSYIYVNEKSTNSIKRLNSTQEMITRQKKD